MVAAGSHTNIRSPISKGPEVDDPYRPPNTYIRPPYMTGRTWKRSAGIDGRPLEDNRGTPTVSAVSVSESAAGTLDELTDTRIRPRRGGTNEIVALPA